jgi:RNA polymerase sigma-70 factor, ECF subfamily
MITHTQVMKPAASGQDAEWDSLYAEQLPRVYNFFHYWVGDRSLAEDLTSTTFEKAWRSRDRYRPRLGAFSTWLFAIARNVGLDYFRQAHAAISLDTIREYADSETLDATVQRHNDFARLSTLLAQLQPRERQLVALKYGAELTNREIAKLTRLSESNVGTLLHRVVQQLRIAWDEKQ